MQVILKEDVLNLGYKDDVVTVKDGYGRNYLIPQGKAVIATPSALKMLAENMKQRAHKLEKIKNVCVFEKKRILAVMVAIAKSEKRILLHLWAKNFSDSL